MPDLPPFDPALVFLAGQRAVAVLAAATLLVGAGVPAVLLAVLVILLVGAAGALAGVQAVLLGQEALLASGVLMGAVVLRRGLVSAQVGATGRSARRVVGPLELVGLAGLVVLGAVTAGAAEAGDAFDLRTGTIVQAVLRWAAGDEVRVGLASAAVLGLAIGIGLALALQCHAGPGPLGATRLPTAGRPGLAVGLLGLGAASVGNGGAALPLGLAIMVLIGAPVAGVGAWREPGAGPAPSLVRGPPVEELGTAPGEVAALLATVGVLTWGVVPLVWALSQLPLTTVLGLWLTSGLLTPVWFRVGVGLAGPRSRAPARAAPEQTTWVLLTVAGLATVLSLACWWALQEGWPVLALVGAALGTLVLTVLLSAGRAVGR